MFGDPLYFIPVTIFSSVLDSLHLCYRLLCLATLEFGISTNSDQKVEMKTFPVSTLSQGKYCLLYRESCPHYRNFPASPLFYLVQCSVSHEHVCYVGFHQRCMEKNIYTGHSSCCLKNKTLGHRCININLLAVSVQ